MREKPYNGATYRMLVKDEKGQPIGFIRLREDGTFDGELMSGTIFNDSAGEMVKLGLSDEIAMYPVFPPAKQACVYTHAHTREFCGNPDCRES